MTAVRFRLGTRGSPLALAQATFVRERLAEAHGLDPEAIEICVIRTTGDAVRDRPLAELGGKGLFTKELEEALLSGAIDLAVHSAKDVPTFLPDGLWLAAFPVREDPRDVFIGGRTSRLADLPKGARIGTASVRREALLRRLRPDLSVSLLRGNVHTRLEKVANGAFDGSILALAGLKRLGLADRASELLDPSLFLPAVGQGAIAIEVRTDDARTASAVAHIDDTAVSAALHAERAFLAVLDGSCRAPIAGHAQVRDGRLTFRGLLISPDGTEMVETSREGAAAEAEVLGRDAGAEVKGRASAALLAAIA